MTFTTETFIAELKKKPLANYTMSELQVALQEAANIYSRFDKHPKQKDDREVLNAVWNKMAEQYQVLFDQKYPDSGRIVYKRDWMIANITKFKEEAKSS